MSQEKTTEPTGSVSSFFGAIKGALFEDEPSKKDATKPSIPVSAAPGVPGVAGVAVATNDQHNDPSKPNPMGDSMMGIVMSKTTAFTALVEALTPLEQFIPDEGARFKAAYSIVGKTRTVDQIVQAIDMQHIQALETEIARFNSQAKSQETNEVAARQREIAALQDEIRRNTEESDRIRKQAEVRLVELVAASNKAAQKVAQKEREIAEKNAAIAQVNAQFTAAVGVVRGTLQDARAKVLRYLSA